jgi:DNA-binding transcriptional LysR family regulator
MKQIDLKQIDLNLLVILKTLLDENNVTKASEKLHLSQSATSHALKRLRAMFKDPLFERSPLGMIPTPRALALQESLESILADIEKIVAEPIFSPETAEGTIRIATSDYSTTIVLPLVLKELGQKSPLINIECCGWYNDTFERIKSGEIDLGLGVLAPHETSELRSQNLFSESFVSIVRQNHPILQENITLESYLNWPHALVTISGSPIVSIKLSPKSHVDQILEELGVKRRVMLKLPHFLAAPLIISETDMILTLPHRIALLFEKFVPIKLFNPPIDLGNYNYMQIWHKRSDNVPVQMWLRNLIKSQTQDL